MADCKIEKIGMIFIRNYGVYFSNSDFKNYLVKTDFDDELKMSMRMIDWTRGNPYIFRIEDLDMLEQSEMMFARKFSAETDKRIIKHIVAKYK